MTRISTLTLVSPGRTSSGGSAFSRQLADAVTDICDARVSTAALPPSGRSSLPADIADSDVVVFLGARTVQTRARLSIFWPLNVAPLDNSLNFLPHTSMRNRARHLALRARLSRSISRADALCFGSHYARSLYMAQYPRASQLPYRVIPGGTPSLEIAHRPGAHSSSTRLVLCCSHLYPYKGIIEFVRAIGQIKTHIPDDVEFRVAGADRDPVYAAAVRNEVYALGLQDIVTIAEATPDELSELYSRATMAVFPSTCENAGSFALFDGLHYGLPTICSDRSSMPEMARNSTALVNPFQVSRFAETMLDVLSDPNRRTDLTNKALAWAESAPTWRDRAKMLVEFADDQLEPSS